MDLTTTLERKNRLIVLMPETLAGNPDLAHKVFWMAMRNQCDVLYLTLVDEEDRMLSAARGMTTMKALTAGDHLTVTAQFTQTSLWLKTLREVYRPGDRIVCHQEQSVKRGFLNSVAADKFLREALAAPVITVSGFYHPEKDQIAQWLRTFATWLGFLLILLCFTVLEISVGDQYSGVLGKVLLSLLVTVEIGAIWAWDSFTG